MFHTLTPILLTLSFLASATFAQSVAGLGGIAGTVSDATGARIQDAEVVVSNSERGVNRKLTTNQAGIFTAGSLVPGSGYHVSITKTGFARTEAKSITVQVGQLVDIQFALRITAAATSVEVKIGRAHV